MPEFRVSRIETQEALEAALAIRTQVFVDEQHVPIGEEVDGDDTLAAIATRAVHVLGRLDGAAIATARLVFDPQAETAPHIGRVAVLLPHRGHGYGAAIMQALHAEARARGYGAVTLAAQVQAIPFYERLGYVARGPVFLDAGIAHRAMDLRFER